MSDKTACEFTVCLFCPFLAHTLDVFVYVQLAYKVNSGCVIAGENLQSIFRKRKAHFHKSAGSYTRCTFSIYLARVRKFAFDFILESAGAAYYGIIL